MSTGMGEDTLEERNDDGNEVDGCFSAMHKKNVWGDRSRPDARVVCVSVEYEVTNSNSYFKKLSISVLTFWTVEALSPSTSTGFANGV